MQHINASKIKFNSHYDKNDLAEKKAPTEEFDSLKKSNQIGSSYKSCFDQCLINAQVLHGSLIAITLSVLILPRRSTPSQNSSALRAQHLCFGRNYAKPSDGTILVGPKVENTLPCLVPAIRKKKQTILETKHLSSKDINKRNGIRL